MPSTAENILKKNIELNPYGKLFEKAPNPESRQETDKINTLGIILPDINAGKEPDIETAFWQTGMDVKTTRDIIKQITGKINDMKNK